MDHFIQGIEVGTSTHFNTPERRLSWVFKEDDYSLVIRSGSPCGRSFSSH